ncbi:PQQ-binding-like beta-propeller repeat protein [Streptomyces sp900105245]|uniref:PQQ-binding-like beta-propeller repeat protein n=1 Tax=Streptomyces sp. 900105245 TaxID=3154379 RepID=A0ABV1UIR7_9ACTN
MDFAALLRAEFFDRLEQLGILTADITKALGKGFSGATLSRFRNGERVPDRDKLYRLLAYVEEIAGQPLPDEARAHVLERYYAALQATNASLHQHYRLLDERDDSLRKRDRAVSEQRELRAQLTRCEEELANSRLRLATVEREAAQAAEEARAVRAREQEAEDEINRLSQLHEVLSTSARKARQRQKSAQREVERLHDLLVQQDLHHSRAEDALTQENAQLREELDAALARAEEQAGQSQRARDELDGVRQQLKEAEERNRQLADSNTVVRRSQTQLSGLLASARHQEKAARKRLESAQQKVAALEGQRLVAERKVADLEERLIAAYRSRDVLLEQPEAPGAAVAAAEEVVDGAWEALGKEIARIERKTVVPGEGTTPSPPGDVPRQAQAAVHAPSVPPQLEPSEPAEASPPPRGQGATQDPSKRRRDQPVDGKRKPPVWTRSGTGEDRPAGEGVLSRPQPRPAPERQADAIRPREVAGIVASWLAAVAGLVALAMFLAWLFPDDSTTEQTDSMEAKAHAQWRAQLPRPLSGMPISSDGVVTVPAYFGAVYGFDTKSGKKLWEVKTKDYGNGRVAATGEKLFFADGQYLRSLDVRTGKPRWKYHTAVNESVVANNEAVFSSWGGIVQAYRASDGKRLWSTTLEDHWDGPNNTNTEMAATEDTLYLQGADGDLRTMNIATGKPGWKKKLGADSARTGVLQISGKLIVSTKDAIMALDAKTGKELWKSSGKIGGLNIVSDGHTLYYESYTAASHYLWAVDINSGKQKWHKTWNNNKTWLNPQGNIAASSDRIYYQDGDYQLIALDAATGDVLQNYSQENNIIGFLLATKYGVYTAEYNHTLSYFPAKVFG